MPAFAITSHAYPETLNRLSWRLHPYPTVIHLDRRADRGRFAQHAWPPNSQFVPEERSIRVVWAGLTVVDAMRVAMRDALLLVDDDDYIVTLSGTDYPLRPIEDLADHLGRSTREFIRFFLIDDSSEQYRQQVERRHYRDLELATRISSGDIARRFDNALRRLGSTMTSVRRRAAPPHLTLAFGSQFFAMTRACAVDTLGQMTAELDRYFRGTFSPDEKYFHSVVASGDYCERTVSGGPEPFPGAGTYRMANLHHVHPSLSKWYSIADLDEVEASPQWFIRKVRLPESRGLLDYLDERA